jgi:hypothetical protein
MKQTSIEWLQSKLPSLFENDDNGFYAEIFAQAKEMHKTEQEISDKKILDAAEEHSDSFLNKGVAMSSFARGCYWYREQLKGDA